MQEYKDTHEAAVSDGLIDLAHCTLTLFPTWKKREKQTAHIHHHNEIHYSSGRPLPRRLRPCEFRHFHQY
jgi:hypothetical protein